MEQYTVTAVGTIYTPFSNAETAPRQGTEAPGRIEFAPEMADALIGLSAGRRVELLFWCHRVTERRLISAPKTGGAARGVFTLRGTSRPNPIGVTTVTVTAVEGLTVHFRGADMLNGTPLLDMKAAMR